MTQRRRVTVKPVILTAVAASALSSDVSAFVAPSVDPRRSHVPFPFVGSTLLIRSSSPGLRHRPPMSTKVFMAEVDLPAIEEMRPGEMKKELESYGVSTKSYLEKSELSGALKKARDEGMKPKANRSAPSSPSPSAPSAKSRDERIEEEMKSLQSKKASELKEELQDLGVSTKSFLEKSEFLKALAEARVDGVKASPSGRGGGNDEEGYAEYVDVEVLTDKDAGPRRKGSGQQDARGQGGSPFGSGSPFGGGGSPFGGSMSGMGGIADMLKNMGMGGAAGANPFGGGAAGGANPFGGAAGANPFGDMGGMGNMGDQMGNVQEMMKNPKVQQLMAKAQSNPKFMKAMSECMGNPAAFAKYQNDPEIGGLIKELQKYI